MEIYPVCEADAKELLAIYAPYVSETAVSFEYEAPSIQEFTKRIIAITEKYPYIKAVKDGEILGYAYANTFKAREAYNHSVEVTIYVKNTVKRCGIGKSLYTELERLLKDMGILNMNACIAVPSKEDARLTEDSMKFHEKMGFQFVGRFHNSGYKFDTWYDMIWMEKMIGNHKGDIKEVSFGSWQKCLMK